MVIEHLIAEGNNVPTTPPDHAQPSTWADKWDLWWMRIGACGWALTVLNIFWHLERSVWTSSLELKLVLAAPLVGGGVTACEMWKARRDGKIEKRIADSVLWSIAFTLWVVYFGMFELRHLPR